ncbi:superoxide dismutase [Sulfurimonas sp. HSL-1656]|uniref:superoxide dismutase n=1 Tax=Thiomicrolovo subterrani TaxID=3131934 RepID=UPI0031F965E5
MHLNLPSLPFEEHALEPYISAETLAYHHGKHHAAYVKKYNELITGSTFEGKPLLEVLRTAEGALFNNGAQAFNHDFYWKCLTPDDTAPSEALAAAVAEAFGSVEGFKEAFAAAATSLFGSGWTWLIINEKGALEIENGSNAYTPVQTEGKHPLLTCDVWEHAYYIDCRNARPTYVENFWHLINWDFVSENYKQKCRVSHHC